ncbi:MAG: class I SAM-dependent methyltransferase [Gammaproteobacteria bacterium]
MTKRISLTKTAHEIIRPHLRKGMVAVDATVGNGHDTLFLTQCVEPTGHVFGFDVQPEAIAAAYRRLQQQGMHEFVTLFLTNHAQMAQTVPLHFHGNIRAIMFNLGYLPGAEKYIITRADSTLQALDAACCLLAKGGVMTVMAYPGHAGGNEEADCVNQWFQRRNPLKYEYEVILSQHQNIAAPRLFVLHKIR